MLDAGMSSAEIAALNVRQADEITRSSRNPGSGSKHHQIAAEPLSPFARQAVARYLKLERNLDDSRASSAMFLTSRRDGIGQEGEPLSPMLVDSIVGGEANLRTITTKPGAKSSEHVLSDLRQIALAWADAQGGFIPRSIRVVATTFDRVVPALHGPSVTGGPSRAVYLIELEGDSVMGEPIEADRQDAPKEEWAALVVPQSPPLHVQSRVLRPSAPEHFDLCEFGDAHTLV